MKFFIGDKVVEKNSLRPRSSYCVEKVVSILDGALLIEHYGTAFDGEIHQFDDDLNAPGTRSWREGIRRHQEDDFLTPEEAIQEIHRLDLEQNKLTQEFEAVQSKIEDKLQKAAALVKEAGAIAKTCDKDFYDLKKECMPLYRVLEEGGWSHSHMSC